MPHGCRRRDAAADGAFPGRLRRSRSTSILAATARRAVSDLIAGFLCWNVYDKPALTAQFSLDRVLEAVRKR
jgi:hypothetical protein